MNKRIKKLFDDLGNTDPIKLSLQATLILFLFSEWVVGDDWRFYTPLYVFASLGIVIPGAYKHWVIWYGIAISMLLKTLFFWWTQDNHLFVLTYWSISIAIALSFPNPEKIIAQNGRLIIGLAFFFATLWKGFLSPDFMNGSYFHYTFLTDSRFKEEAELLSGITIQDVQNNIITASEVALDKKETVTLKTNSALRNATLLITWHTAIIEGLLALTFLWPLNKGLSRYRNFVLIAFSWTTYLAAPIHTFGWSLCGIALGQTTRDEKIDRALLLLTLPLLFIYKHVPFVEWIVSLIK
jgi:hypothetical protein